jgi:hypothetical protein
MIAGGLLFGREHNLHFRPKACRRTLNTPKEYGNLVKSLNKIHLGKSLLLMFCTFYLAEFCLQSHVCTFICINTARGKLFRCSIYIFACLLYIILKIKI